MTEGGGKSWPVKRVPSHLGRKLIDFAADEKDNFQNSLYDLIEEMHFFDTLANLMDRWINRPEDLRAGEALFHNLCAFVRAEMFRGCASYMRWHHSVGMVSSRMALESALYAEAVASGLMSGEQYLRDGKKRSQLPRELRNLEKAGKLPNARFLPLLDTMAILSPAGAHAEVIVWGRNMVKGDDGWFMSLFQQAGKAEKFIYDFLGILWFCGLAFRSFFEINRERFSVSAEPYLVELNAWKDTMNAREQEYSHQI